MLSEVKGLQVQGHVLKTFWPRDVNSLGEETRASLKVAKAHLRLPALLLIWGLRLLSVDGSPSPLAHLAMVCFFSGFPESACLTRPLTCFLEHFPSCPNSLGALASPALILKDRAGPVDLASFAGSPRPPSPALSPCPVNV